MGHHAVVIGSTGQIGRASVAALLDDGWTVTSVRRGTVRPPDHWKDRGVVDVTADRDDPAALRTALAADGGADLVVDTIAYDAEHAGPLLDAAADIGHAVVVSSASVYADGAGRTLDEATGAHDFPRFDGRSVFHTTSVANLAEVIRLAAGKPATRVVNAGDPNPPDVTAVVEAVCAVAGHTTEIVPLTGPPRESGVGKTPWSVPRPFVIDMNAAGRELGYTPVTSYADAVAATCDWLRERMAERSWREAFPSFAGVYGDIMKNYAAEDDMLARLPN